MEYFDGAKSVATSKWIEVGHSTLGREYPTEKRDIFKWFFKIFNKTLGNHIIVLSLTLTASHIWKIRLFGRSVMDILTKTYFSVLIKVRGTASRLKLKNVTFFRGIFSPYFSCPLSIHWCRYRTPFLSKCFTLRFPNNIESNFFISLDMT